VDSSVPIIDDTFQPIFQTGSLKAAGGTFLILGPNDGDVEAGGTEYFSYVGDDYGSYVGGVEFVEHNGAVNPVVYDQYIGTGTYTITLTALQYTFYGSFGGVQALIDPIDTSGTVEITYHYIPEPATVGLLALGSLLVTRRRRTSR